MPAPRGCPTWLAGKGGPVGIRRQLSGVPVAGGEGGPAGTRRHLSRGARGWGRGLPGGDFVARLRVPMAVGRGLVAGIGVPMAVGRGFVTSSQGCPWLWTGIRHPALRVRMAGGEAARWGLVASSRAAPHASRPTGSRRCTAPFSPSARFCIFILNRLFVVLLSLDSELSWF